MWNENLTTLSTATTTIPMFLRYMVCASPAPTPLKPEIPSSIVRHTQCAADYTSLDLGEQALFNSTIMEHPQGHCDIPRGDVGIILALETDMSFKLAPFLLGTAWQSITSFLPGKGFELKFPFRFLDVTDTNWSSQCFSFL